MSENTYRTGPSLLVAAASILALLPGPATAGAGPASAPAPLAVHFEVVDNLLEGGGQFEAALTLTNRGPAALEGGWTLYFSFTHMLLPESFPEDVVATHVNGDLFALAPAPSFAPLAPGASVRIPFRGRGSVFQESDAPAGVYLVSTDADGRPRPPRAVAEVSAAPLTTPAQTTRGPDDRLLVSTPAVRFARNAGLTWLAPDALVPILPTPARLVRGDGRLTLDARWSIHHAPGLEGEAAALAAGLRELLGAELGAVASAERGERVLALGLDAGLGSEAYRLRASPEGGVVLEGGDPAGVFYAVQSLLQLLPARPGEGGLVLPDVVVEDAPRFAYRGMHLDVARNFQTAEAVRRLLDAMSLYKLNRFHFHLTDDEGWRLEIAALPELTGVGARRGHTLDESDRLVPAYGSGPEPDRPPGSGYYDRATFVELLRHARARHIEVVPEIDLPGHARAAIVAMEARRTRLLSEGREPGEAEAFLLQDPGDTSDYMSVQMWRRNVIDVCRPSTYRFVRSVVEELVDLYAEAGAPLTTVHIGGDEVPHGAWEGSPACQRLIASGAVGGTAELPAYFVHEVSAILAEHGLVTAGWEEIALAGASAGEAARAPNRALLDRRLRPYVWNNVWGSGAEDLGYRLANAGFDVVFCGVTNLYFDLAYEKDPLEPGYDWGGFVDTRAAWELAPFDIFQNAREDLLGRPLDPAGFGDRARLTPEGRRHVLGIQGQLWSENLRSPGSLEYMAFPKLLGLAERAWAPPPPWAAQDDPAAHALEREAAWNAFANRLGQRELPRLDRLFGGVAYRLPPPGAVVEDDVLRANVAFPGLEVRYTTDGSAPTAASPRYGGPVAVDGPVALRTFDTRGRGSRVARVDGRPR